MGVIIDEVAQGGRGEGGGGVAISALYLIGATFPSSSSILEYMSNASLPNCWLYISANDAINNES